MKEYFKNHKKAFIWLIPLVAIIVGTVMIALGLHFSTLPWSTTAEESIFTQETISEAGTAENNEESGITGNSENAAENSNENATETGSEPQDSYESLPVGVPQEGASGVHTVLLTLDKPEFTPKEAPPFGTVKKAEASKDKASKDKASKEPGGEAEDGEVDPAPWISVHEDLPYFSDKELLALLEKNQTKIILSPLDEAGRAGTALMLAGPETLPQVEREATGVYRPSGWHQNKYPGIVDSQPPYLMNRAHLLMWALTGLTQEHENLISGTRYMNTDGMLEAESRVLNYIKKTGNHVLYRVTPVFEGDDLFASGVLLEARSQEDEDCVFCIYVYNVQPGVTIDYASGENHLTE